MYLHKTPYIVRSIFPEILWKVNTSEKEIYLTFDDGPIPEATPWVLDQLNAYDAKATFFMVGENIKKYPDVYQMVLKNGHRVANHTFNHLKGWSTKTKTYLANIDQAEQLFDSRHESLFRPPHGQLTLPQLKAIKARSRIIMWDVLSGDFDKKLSSEQCLKKSIKNTQKGSIIVFHDSIKTIDFLKDVLPKYLEHFSSLGFKFKAL